MERQVKGIWIPLEIWQAENLSWNEKILLMEIDSFTSQDMDCYFSNEYIGEMLGIKPDTASKLVSSLIQKGYIRQVRFDGRKRYLASCMEIRCRVGEKSEAGYDKNPRQTPTKIIDNNIDNKTSNKQSIDISPIPKKFDFGKALRGIGIYPTLVDEWLKVRKVKKAVNTETAFKAIEKEIAEAERNGHTPDECINLAVVKSWCGFKWEWMQNELDNSRRRQTTLPPTPSPAAELRGPRPRHDAHLDVDFSQFYKD